ncbi:MAG: MFS transporter [Pseudomonadota bacterium]|nr:MFS transporter [Pseudomonadota bacterium]
MRALLVPVAALLLSQAFLLAGHGLQLTLLPLRATLEGFSDAQVAFTGSAYFIGFVVGCVLTPRMVQKVGHIRAFAVMASSYSAAALAFDLVPHFASWLLLRVLSGVTISGLYMVLESWLNERATPDTRGTLLGVYTLINLLMVVAGQMLVNVAAPEASTLFAIAAILISFAVLPVSLSTAIAPAPPTSAKVDVPRVWRMAPVAPGRAMASGIITGAFWSLGPVYGRKIGFNTFDITLLMTASVVGGALLQIPLRRLSDLFDRRLVLLGTALAGAVASLALVPLGAGGHTLFMVSVWGACTMTLYAICVAHANDHAEPGEFVTVATVILLVNGGSGAIGAPLASLCMELIGPGGLFAFSAGVLGLFSAGTMYRRTTRARPVLDETGPFIAVAEVTPAALEMDPRVDQAVELEEIGPVPPLASAA